MAEAILVCFLSHRSLRFRCSSRSCGAKRPEEWEHRVRGHPGGIPGPSWDHPGLILGTSWAHLGPILGSSWAHPGPILGQSWAHPDPRRRSSCKAGSFRASGESLGIQRSPTGAPMSPSGIQQAANSHLGALTSVPKAPIHNPLSGAIKFMTRNTN